MHEPLPVERPSEILQQLDPPLVDLDQLVEGGEDRGDAALGIEARQTNWKTRKIDDRDSIDSGARDNAILDRLTPFGAEHHQMEVLRIDLIEPRPDQCKAAAEAPFEPQGN